MFERYTERAERVLFFARYEAGRAGSSAVEPEHLLLALIREGQGLSARIFERARVSAEEVRRAIESRTTSREATSSVDDLPLSAPTKQVLEFAAQESGRLLHNYVGTEHLLLGVFREERSLAALVLAERGLQINQVREDIVMLLCAPQAMPPVRQMKPDIPPSTEVTIKPTERRPHEGVSARRASDYWVLEGIPLRDMLSRLHNIQKERIELPLSLNDDRRYDFLLVLPQRESRETIDRLMREGIEKYFRIGVATEVRDMDVYVLTAPNGAISAMRTSLDEPGSFGWVDIQTPSAPDNFIGFDDRPWRREENEAPAEDELSSMAGKFLKSLAGGWKRGTASIRGMSAASTMAQLCEMLEATLDRPVIDETNLDGSYDLNIRTQAESGERFLYAMCDRLGLAATAARRNVTMLVVRDA
jgi:uncharacterized protein (TIGR03435 family)